MYYFHQLRIYSFPRRWPLAKEIGYIILYRTYKCTGYIAQDRHQYLSCHSTQQILSSASGHLLSQGSCHCRVAEELTVDLYDHFQPSSEDEVKPCRDWGPIVIIDSQHKRSGPFKGMLTTGCVHEALLARFWKCGGRLQSRRRKGHSELCSQSVMSGACMACACKCQERIVSRQLSVASQAPRSSTNQLTYHVLLYFLLGFCSFLRPCLPGMQCRTSLQNDVAGYGVIKGLSRQHSAYVIRI